MVPVLLAGWGSLRLRESRGPLTLPLGSQAPNKRLPGSFSLEQALIALPCLRLHD